MQIVGAVNIQHSVISFSCISYKLETMELLVGYVL